MALEGGVGEVGAVAGEGEEGQLAELEGLGVGQRGQARRGGVVVVGAVGEDAEEGVVGAVARVVGGGEGGDLGRLEELGEDEGVGGRGCLADEVDGGAGGCGGLGESEEGLGMVSRSRLWARVSVGNGGGHTSRALRALVCSMVTR